MIFRFDCRCQTYFVISFYVARKSRGGQELAIALQVSAAACKQITNRLPRDFLISNRFNTGLTGKELTSIILSRTFIP